MFGNISDKELEVIDNYFVQLLEYTRYKKNRFNYIEKTGNKKLDKLLNKWNSLIEEADKDIKNDMKVIGEIVLTSDKVDRGIYNCQVKSTSTNPMIATLIKTMNTMLEGLNDSTSRILRVMNSYTNNDYRDKININQKYKEQLLELMESINVLGDTLGKTAKANLENGQILENNSAAMNTSMNNLAAKSNEQAASLEETAAALEEITSITRSNADNASKMASLGQTVKKSVTTGQDLASKTASSMDEINDKVAAINEAITVIDQIAFQTNILSLNAAVEAATAGEAGKGFAVVAQEVRNLASRSAEAAKEIKNLVEDATQKANDGKVISSNMINGYDELNKHISETIHIIENVSSASKEQMTGIEQINDAMNMLDRVTQENANEANNVKNISDEVSQMANELVADAQHKRFN